MFLIHETISAADGPIPRHHSPRNRFGWNRLLIGLTLTALLGGCEIAKKSPDPAPLAPPPATDAAMQTRHWEPTRARFASEQVIVGPTDFPLVTRANLPNHGAALVDPLIFLANVAILPISLFFYPPDQPIKTETLNMAPSYSANPALPPTPQPPPDIGY